MLEEYSKRILGSGDRYEAVEMKVLVLVWVLRLEVVWQGVSLRLGEFML